MSRAPKRTSARAVVTLTLQIDVRSSWGGDCTADQINKQATDEALGHMRQHFAKEPHVKVIGIPSVETIIVRRE